MIPTKPLTDDEQAETEAFVKKYLASKDAERAQDEYTRLREAHTEMLKAAKRAVLVMKDTRILGVAGRIDIAIEDLQAAIAKAEKPAP